MKSVFALWVCMALCVISVVYVLFLKSDKIGYVDADKVYNEYALAKIEKDKFDKKMNDWQVNLDTLDKEITELILQKEKNPELTSSIDIQINRKREEFLRYKQGVEENVRKEQAQLVSKLSGGIKAALQTYGKDNGFKIILIANHAGVIAYAEDGVDVTASFIQSLNASK
ncbi:periplasmic chaperone [Sphingobacterium spiritivorum]|uniref:Periplasmic chaperone n=1 Tax=Sphingobacterium spiritivorum TaxID=258 RepID=A0A380CRB5_SPHSI|nr:OmpH family outer membrane protein [Sphingobacterium spiritivorum]SUJ25581.1 periplasmic chaperone [Sphingobacterium spiritivorum]